MSEETFRPSTHKELRQEGDPYSTALRDVDRSGALERSANGEFDIERVIDIPLAVTLRFGQREMRLRDVMELKSGFLVELDRQIEEPVDLLLGERVIARGEVVIVDGNYGLRVTEVVHSGPILAR